MSMRLDHAARPGTPWAARLPRSDAMSGCPLSKKMVRGPLTGRGERTRRRPSASALVPRGTCRRPHPHVNGPHLDRLKQSAGTAI